MIEEATALHSPGSADVTAPGFDDLIAAYQPAIMRYAMHLTGNQHDAEDLCQETMIRAFRAFGRLDGEANHRAWLYRIATNAFLSNQRKAARVERLDGESTEALPAQVVDEAGRIDARDLLADIDRFMQSLPAKQRAAFIQRKFHEMSYAEVGATLRCSEAAARASVHEALRRLKDEFGHRLHG